jgi:hypothetical protein
VRRDGVAAALASSSVPTRLIVWTPQHSPLAALRDALDDPTHEFSSVRPTDLAPLPTPHD